MKKSLLVLTFSIALSACNFEQYERHEKVICHINEEKVTYETKYVSDNERLSRFWIGKHGTFLMTDEGNIKHSPGTQCSKVIDSSTPINNEPSND